MKLIYKIKGFENYCFDENRVLWKLPNELNTKQGIRYMQIRVVTKQKNNGKYGYWVNDNGKQKYLYMNKVQKLLKPCLIEIEEIKEEEPF